VEHARCSHCRNPIRGRQAEVRHAGSVSFHLDCWQSLHLHVQEDYLRRVEHDGIDQLLLPYSRIRPVEGLPRQAELVDEPSEIPEETPGDVPVEAGAFLHRQAS
jgi:hypothetical protein